MNSTSYEKTDGTWLKVKIKEDQITVPPESQATLQIGILNSSPDEDYVDILVKGVPAEWVTVHTPVLYLAAGDAKLATVTIQPPAVDDNRAIQYPLDVHVISQSDPKVSAVARSAVTVATYQSRGRIGVTLGSIQFAVTPGTGIDIPVLLQNRGEEEDVFRLSVTGLPPLWISSNSTLTRLEPNSSTEIVLTLQVPRSPQAAAGRTRFTIQFASQLFPTQTTEVECILTIAAFSQFSVSLMPASFRAGQFGQVIIFNEGNTVETYSLTFQSRDDELIFEKAVQVPRPGQKAGAPQVQIAYVEIPRGERFQVQAGERGIYLFRSRLWSPPILGNEQTYHFGVEIGSTANQVTELSGEVSERGYIPFWGIPVGLIGFLAVCLLFLIPLRSIPTSSRATQTAAVMQTQAALSGTADSDGDGLTDEREAALGTDPLLPDTDGDRLLDREEVETYLTDPLNVDTDGDGLDDGDEIQVHQTNPLDPDTDGDRLRDGDEVRLGTDPRNPDTDGDGLRDGDELRLGTDPRNPDTDGDGLPDGQENETCPHPRNPDSDGDGIIDGRDLDPCDSSNPASTATAAAQITPTVPTATETTVPPTSPPTVTLTPPPPDLGGIMLLASNRDGDFEIYALNLVNQSLARLTNNAAQDTQPALAPDSIQVAYVTNQDGNDEIYLTGVDGRVPLNLTNHPADDLQPAWSPDGNWIAFTTSRDGNQEIYIMRRDGSEVRNLTNHPANDFAATWFSVGGVFGSQDWIAFTTTRDGNQEIYKVRPDGSGLTNLTQNPANDHSPAGFTGGGLLAFVTDRNGNSEIYTMTDTGGSQTNITNNPAQDLDPSINPGGSWIAFATDRDGQLDVYFIGINGGMTYNLTNNASQDRYPDW